MSREFIQESGLRRARRYVDADLRKEASTAELEWLYKNPLLWLRALQLVRYETHLHIAKDKRNLEPLKPMPGETPSNEFLLARRELEDKSRNRIHFLQLVNRHIEEVKALVGPQPIREWLIVGDLIAAFSEIAILADSGELEAAADKANYHAKRLKKLARQREGS